MKTESVHKFVRRVVQEEADFLKPRKRLLREDVMRVATAAADVVDEPGEVGSKLFHLFSRFDEKDLKDFVALPQAKGVELMMQTGVEPASAKAAWLKTWQAASAVAYPEEYSDTW